MIRAEQCSAFRPNGDGEFRDRSNDNMLMNHERVIRTYLPNDGEQPSEDQELLHAKQPEFSPLEIELLIQTRAIISSVLPCPES